MKKKKMKQDHALCENAYQDSNNDLEKVNPPDGNYMSAGATETCTIVTKKKKRKQSTEECAVYEAVPESIQIVPKKKKTILGKDGDFSHEVESNGIGAKKKRKGEMIAEGSAAPHVPGNKGISPKKKKKMISGEPTAAPLVPEMKETVPKKKKKQKMMAEEPTAASLMTKTYEVVPQNKKKDKMTAEEPTATLVHGTNEIVPKKNKKKEKMIAMEPAAAPLTQEMKEKVPKKKRREKIMAEEPIAALLMTKPIEALPIKKKNKDKKMAEEPSVPLVQETKEKVPKKKKVKMITAEPAAAPLVQEIKEKVPKKKKEKLISEEPTATLSEQEVKEKVKTKKKEKMMAQEPTSAPLAPEPKGTGPKKKKKEMMAEESTSAPLVPEPDEMGAKKKKKEMMAEESTSAPLVPEPIEMGAKKKKKTEEGLVQEASKIGQTKKKKRVAEKGPVPPTELETKEFAPPMKKKCVTSDCVTELKVKKKKKKLKQDSELNRDDATCIEGEMKATCIVDLPRPKKKTISAVYEHSESQPVPDVSEQKKLKQKKNRSVTFVLEHSITSSDNGIAAPDADMSKSNHDINDSVVCHENNEAGGSGASSNESTSSKKHKKRKRKHSFPGDVESSENNKDAESDCAPARHCGGDETLAGISADPEMACAVKKKRCKEVKTISLKGQDDNPHAASYNEEGKKKKKIQKDDKTKQKTNKKVAEQISDRDEADGNEKDAGEDVMLVTVKEGNCDEVEIDKVRRKALQEEIDRESGNTKALRFGQWDTASFQSSGQQRKFLKLMGAFKKGSQVAFAPPAHHVIANRALGKEEEVVLERNLEAEFDKALNWKRNSGIGLGFQPEQNKKFYIDKNSSKSVKFE